MKKKGFTLIELVVVMAIIAILALLVIGAITVARNAAKETVNRSNGKTVQTALEGLYVKKKAYNVSPGSTPLCAVTVGKTLSEAATCLGATINTTQSTTGGGGKVTAIDSGTYTIEVYESDGATLMDTYKAN